MIIENQKTQPNQTNLHDDIATLYRRKNVFIIYLPD